MVFTPPPNCRNIDNWRCCKLESHRGAIARMFDVRPRCILDRIDRPRDGKWTCPDYDPLPRPAPPKGFRSAGEKPPQEPASHSKPR